MNYDLIIIIPTYHNLDMLKRLIKQIYEFTPPVFALTIIEDGQIEIVVNYLKNLEKEKRNFYPIYHTENKGVALSWNDGLRKGLELNCRFFAFFNDDIEIYPNWWKEVEEEFGKGINLISTNQPNWGHKFLAGWFFVFDKTLFETIGFFDEQFAPFWNEDTDFIYRYMQKAPPLRHSILTNPNLKHHVSTTINKIQMEKPEFFKAIVKKVSDALERKWR